MLPLSKNFIFPNFDHKIFCNIFQKKEPLSLCCFLMPLPKQRTLEEYSATTEAQAPFQSLGNHKNISENILGLFFNSFSNLSCAGKLEPGKINAASRTDHCSVADRC